MTSADPPRELPVALLDRAFDEVQIGLALLSLTAHVLRVNPAGAALLGRKPDELVGQELGGLVHPDDLREALGEVRRLEAAGSAGPISGWNRQRTGAGRPSAAPCRDPLAVRELRCTPPWDAALIGFPPESIFPEDGARTDERMTEFQQNWEAIIREWSLRWGQRVRGWWIDGCYQADRMYRQLDGVRDLPGLLGGVPPAAEPPGRGARLGARRHRQGP